MRTNATTAPVTRRLAVLVVTALLAVGCGGAGETRSPAPASTRDPAGPEPVTVRLYSTITQETIDAVLDAYRDAAPHVAVEVIRAPTGELTARIATEERQGRILGDVLWVTDPLTVLDHEARGTLHVWEPPEADALPADARTRASFGARLSQLVIVHDPAMTAPPASWADLATVGGPVALPDPAFAGSAFAALGYFSLAEGYGLGYYEALAAAGAVQVASPGDVISGVAEGRFSAGLTLDFLAADAIAAGSPLAIVWPDPGAITVFSPVAVFADSQVLAEAEALVNFLLGPDGQAAVASSGVQPARPDVDGPAPPAGAPLVAPDWSRAFAQRDELLAAYDELFGP